RGAFPARARDGRRPRPPLSGHRHGAPRSRRRHPASPCAPPRSGARPPADARSLDRPPPRRRRHRAGRGAPPARACRPRGLHVRRASTLAAVLLLAACGLKTAPLPPEKVQPLEATSLVASSTTGGVQLVWRRPTNYTGGKRMNDLGGFEIERAGTTED